MVNYRIRLRSLDNQSYVIDGCINHGNKLTKKLAEEIARAEWSDPKLKSISVYDETGTRKYTKIR